MKDKANFYDSAAVLNPNWNSKKGKLLSLNNQAITKLKEYVSILKEIDSQKLAVQTEDDQRNQFANIFDNL